MTFVKTTLFHKAGEGSGGGGDQHNLGWYATETALTTAHPTASDGDYAIVGDTDTVWVWDGDTTAWVDSGAGGIGLPDQTGQSGKFLTTDGTDASWSDKPLVNTATGTEALTIGGVAATTLGATNLGIWAQSGANGVAIGRNACAMNNGANVAIGSHADVEGSGVINSVAIGSHPSVTAKYAIQIGGSNASNSDANTFKVANANGNFEMMSADGTIPTDRLVHAINKYSTMPTAASTNEGWIVQFTGTTDSTYTHGHLYECVSDGQNPATYSWSNIQVQASSGGLPSQTGNAGKFLTTDGTDASWSDKPLVNKAEGYQSVVINTNPDSTTTQVSGQHNVMVGFGARVNHTNAQENTIVGYGANVSGNKKQNVIIGSGAESYANFGTAVGKDARVSADYATQIGCYGQGPALNSDASTFKVANANGNYEMMSADGTIPTARLTKVNSTITLTVAGWSSNTQTVNVTGMTATGVVMVSPDPTDQSAYTSAGVLCTAQAAGTLTFTCDTVPSGDIDVNVVML